MGHFNLQCTAHSLLQGQSLLMKELPEIASFEHLIEKVAFVPHFMI